MHAGPAKRSRKAAFKIQRTWSPMGRRLYRNLRRQGRFAQVTRPDLILLDLNLPRKNGVEVLAEIKTDPELRNIPVVVLTTSPMERQSLLRTYNLPPSCYILKPLNWARFLEAVRSYAELELLIVKNQ